MSIIMWQYKVHERPIFEYERKTRYAFHHLDPLFINAMHHDRYEPIAGWRIKRFATLKKWYKIVRNIYKILKNKHE